jgi:hypothetical protein
LAPVFLVSSGNRVVPRASLRLGVAGPAAGVADRPIPAVH